MKKLCATLLLLSLSLTVACGKASDDEPFSADFSITKTAASLTESVFISDYYGETYVFDSDALSYHDIESFLLSSVENGSDNIAMLSAPLKVALSGNFRYDDIDTLSEICQILNSVDFFPGIEEADISKANVIIHLADSESFSYDADTNGNILRVEVHIPQSSADKRALICEYIMRSCGLVAPRCESEFDSVLSDNRRADFFTDADILLLESLYANAQPGMNRSDFIMNLKIYWGS